MSARAVRSRWFHVLFTVVAVLCGAAAFGAEDDLKVLQQQARALTRERKHAEAAAVYEKILGQAPVESSACYSALRSLRYACDRTRQGKTFAAAAQRTLIRVRRLRGDPKRRTQLQYRYLSLLARYYYDRRLHVPALKYYGELRKHATPRQAVSIDRTLAEVYESAGHLAQAAATWKQVLDANPKDRRARSSLSRVYFRLGQVDQGLAVAQAGGKTDVYSIAERLYTARALGPAEAVARKLAATDARAKVLLGKVLYEQKKFAEAETVFAECFEAAAAESSSVFDIAEKLAALHTARGTAKKLIAEREGALARIPVKAETVPARRKELALLMELKRVAGDRVGALDAALRRRRLHAGKPPAKRRTDWRLTRMGRSALSHLYGQEQYAELGALLGRLDTEKVGGTWVECARHAWLVKTGKPKAAATLAAKLAADAGDKESGVYSLASEFSRWGQSGLYVKLYKRILELEPANSVYDSNAHVRLASYYIARGAFAQAKTHCDAVEASLTARNTGIIGMDQFCYMHVHATFRAAGNDMAVLIAALDDGRPERQAAAARLLGSYGKKEQSAVLKAKLAVAPPKLRLALQRAIRNIKLRGLRVPPQPEPVTDGQMKAMLGRMGKLRWVREDP